MTFTPGARLGPYEILTAIGSGGMGDVYKACDTRLNRTVALKVLGAVFQHDTAGRERLEREARAIAALDHPHICVLHDVGHHDGIDYLVMQFLEGETLAASLSRRPTGLPVEQALRIGTEIAAALDAAHRRGLAHRDLKPSNVMLTKTGVKLLDFGLAKPFADAKVFGSARGDAGTPSRLEATRTAPLTSEGMIVGTLPYMAPEQIEGRTVDARSDIFAFGCVLHEVLTGRRAFEAASQAAVIAAVLERDPPSAAALQPLVPADLEHLIRVCLAKDPDQRWQSAADVGRMLTRIAARPAAVTTASVTSRPFSIVRAVAVVLVVAAGSFLVARWVTPRPAEPPAIVLSVVPPEGAVLDARTTGSLEMALSPDGRTLAFIGSLDGQRRLFLRPLDSLEARAVEGTEGADDPFWSADSTMIGFFAKGKLRKVRREGSEPEVLCGAGRDSGGATWNQDGVIVFSPFFEGALYRVSSAGGTPTPLTVLDATKGETHHFRPRFLPDGRHFVYQVYGRVEAGEYIGSLDSSERRRLIESPGQVQGYLGYVADYAPNHLVFVRDGSLLAQPFDPARGELGGEPARIAEDIARSPGGAAAFTAARDAPVIAYRTADAQRTTRLTWFDRTGRVLGWAGSPAAYEDPVLSPDGTRVVVQRWDTPVRRSIWIVDAERGSEMRFTLNPDDMAPLWSPDGSRVVYASARDTPPNLFVKPLAEAGVAEDRLFSSRFVNTPTSWSRDGRLLIYETIEAETGYDIAAFDFKTRTSTVLVKTPFDEGGARLSPDGRRIAYTSDETGRNEVYVRAFNRPEPALRISTAGGDFPLWRSDGKELFYLEAGRKLMGVAVADTSARFSVSAPTLLFEARFGPSETSPYDVSVDGRRFLVNLVVDENRPSPITVVVNWPRLLAEQ